MSLESKSTKEILFICSDGRSGSTLIDLSLGQIDGFFSGGELRTFFTERMDFNRLCNCGKTFNECSTWNFIVSNLAAKGWDLPNISKIYQKYSHNKYMFLIDRDDPPNDFKTLIDFLNDFYCLVANYTESRVIVDSSKKPVHGFMLSFLKNFNVNSIHLVRDPMAVIASKSKVKKRLDKLDSDVYLPTLGPFRAAVEWNKINVFVSIFRLYPGMKYSLRYEDFILNPQESIKELLDFFGWNVEIPKCISKRIIHLSGVHMASGNPMRLVDKDITIASREDPVFIPFFYRAVVAVISWPFLIKFRYI